jgi:hypothetical protein
MRRLAIAGSQTVDVQQLAYSLGNPIDLEAYLRVNWITVPDPPEVEFIRKPDFQIQDARHERIDVTSIYDPGMVPRIVIPAGYYAGDCDDAATLAASILYVLHRPSSFIAIRRPFQIDFSHVFVRVPLGTGWSIDIDPIVPLERLPLRDIEEVMEVAL